jgi:hypothetical protein
VSLPPAHFGVDPAGRITLEVLPAPLTCLAIDPATGTAIPRPGLPGGAELLATYVIDTRSYEGLAAALRLKLPPGYRVEIPGASRGHRWSDLEGVDRRMDPVTRIDLRSWSLHDVGRAPGPPEDEPTTPFPDRHILGPRVFVDLRRRPDVTHTRPDARQASHLHDDLRHPVPRAPQLWAVHPWNASDDPARRGSDPGFRGPYVYTFDERLQPCGQERLPGDPATWEPFAAEWATVLAHDPRTGLDVPIEVRQDQFAQNPFSGAPLETSPGSGILYRDLAKTRPYNPRPDRSDHPLVLFTEDFWLERLGRLIDLVRAAGVFVSFERGPASTPTGAPPWFCDVCYTELLVSPGP